MIILVWILVALLIGITGFILWIDGPRGWDY